MPELPEVETIKNQLESWLPLEVIDEDYSSVHSSILKNKPFEIRGKKIVSMDRHGKALIINLDSGHMLSHLGMSGSWRISDSPIDIKHTHVHFTCVNKKKKKVYLGYVDPRRFGNLYYLTTSELEKKISKLGRDISNKNFNSKYIYECLQKYPDRELKPFLLEQKFFAGIGNYIACEICARAGLLPNRLNKTLTLDDAKNIQKATKSVLNRSIKNNGMTFSGGYSDTQGDKGDGLKDLVVFYQDICGLCKKTPVKKVVLKTRGTYFCPTCQK